MTDGPLRVAVVGAGVAGTFFALELHRLRPDARIEVFDRGDPAPGAGVVMQAEFVKRIEALHPDLFAVRPDEFRRWNRIVLRVGDGEIATQGHGTYGFGRRALVSHLRELTSRRLGRQITRRDVAEPPAGFDLVVAADGAGSRIRAGLADRFGTAVTSGATRFLWLSTTAELPAMFVLKHVKDAQLIVHAYPHAVGESTLVVEAHPDLISSIGLLDAPVEAIERRLADLLSEHLGGAPVRAHTPGWQAFRTVVNEHWYHGGTVLIGDAAHTVHFSSGSGTTLAVEDGISLAGALAEEPNVEAAVAQYAEQRRPLLGAAQHDGGASQSWFEELSRQQSGSAHQTAFALRTRREMNTFAWFREHDPDFTAGVVRELAREALELPLGTEPVDVPLAVGTLNLRDRYAAVARFGEVDGQPELLLGLGAGAARAHRGPVLSADEYPPSAPSDAPGEWEAWTRPSPPLSVPAPGQTCALVAGERPRETIELAAALRRTAGVGAVGVVVPDDAWLAELSGCDQAADFYAVPELRAEGRVPRTALAVEVRRALGLPVLLLTRAPLPLDEINTLIAAGRVDLAAAAPYLLDHPRRSGHRRSTLEVAS